MRYVRRRGWLTTLSQAILDSYFDNNIIIKESFNSCTVQGLSLAHQVFYSPFLYSIERALFRPILSGRDSGSGGVGVCGRAFHSGRPSTGISMP